MGGIHPNDVLLYLHLVTTFYQMLIALIDEMNIVAEWGKSAKALGLSTASGDSLLSKGFAGVFGNIYG